MNDHPTPLPHEAVDELLSAELDGAFDDAATDLGLDPTTARTRLASTDGVEERRAALRAARDALAELPAIDELVAARLRATAIAEAELQQTERVRERPHRAQRWAFASGAIAAAVALVIGLVAVQSNDSRAKNTAGAPTAQRSDKHAAAAAPSTVVVNGTFASTLGDASDAATLATRAANLSATMARSKKVLGTGAFSSQTDDNGQTSYYSVGPENGSVDMAAPGVPAPYRACRGAAQSFAGSGTLILEATGTVDGKPVEVYVYAQEKRRVVVVVDEHCALLNRTAVG
ncbi:MAG TPA: hypothetical protein VFR41_07740 [Acidimicrobiia bacterium]|nr:hypothetical protein [Acidimicrobiia bacterium]